MPATPQQRQRYNATLRRTQQRFIRRERDAVRAALATYKQLRRNIAAELATVDISTRRDLTGALAAIDDIIAGHTAELSNIATTALNGAIQDGIAFAVDPLIAAQVDFGFRIASLQQVIVLNEFTADLIQGISADMRSRIVREIRLGALGGDSIFNVMRQVTHILGVKGRKVRGVAYEAERIVRTETNRAFNMANQAQLEATAASVPGMRKFWRSTGDARTRPTHLQVHMDTLADPIPAGDNFTVGGSSMSGPLDPSGSAEETINCRCRSVSVHPELGVIRSPRDNQVQRVVNAMTEAMLYV